MTRSLARRKSASIAVGQNASNSVPSGQRKFDEHDIHDLVSEEQERWRAGTGTQVNATGMFQDLDYMKHTPNTSIRGGDEGGGRCLHGFSDVDQIDRQGSNRSSLPSGCSFPPAKMTNIQRWYSESPGREPWCHIPWNGDSAPHGAESSYRGSGERAGTIWMMADNWAYQEESEQDIGAKWSTQGTNGFGERGQH